MKNLSKGILTAFTLAIMLLVSIASCQKIETQPSDDNSTQKAIMKKRRIPPGLADKSFARNCFKGKGNCGIAIVDNTGDNDVQAIILSLKDKNTLHMIFPDGYLNEDADYMQLAKNIEIPSRFVEELGDFQSVTMLKGRYFPGNENGLDYIDIKVKVNK